MPANNWATAAKNSGSIDNKRSRTRVPAVDFLLGANAADTESGSAGT
jgi:hypothetical protein